jgi:hypothetical protein
VFCFVAARNWRTLELVFCLRMGEVTEGNTFGGKCYLTFWQLRPVAYRGPFVPPASQSNMDGRDGQDRIVRASKCGARSRGGRSRDVWGLTSYFPLYLSPGYPASPLSLLGPRPFSIVGFPVIATEAKRE